MVNHSNISTTRYFKRGRVSTTELFRMEHQANLLWINSDSSYNIHEKWLQNNFKKNERAQILLVKNDNILTPESINLVSLNVLICMLLDKSHLSLFNFRCLTSTRMSSPLIRMGNHSMTSVQGINFET